MAALADLIAALSAATGPSRELDAEISTLLFGLPVWKPHGCDHFVSIYSAPIPGEPPRYTSDLNAITGAIKARWPKSLFVVTDGPWVCAASLIAAGREEKADSEVERSGALCLCLAAARLALAEQERA